MRASRPSWLLYTVLWLQPLLISSSQAQPQGPRDVIAGARKARQQKELKAAISATESAAETAPAAAAQAVDAGVTSQTAPQNPHEASSPHAHMQGGNPHAGLADRRKPISEGHEDRLLPSGTLKVRVVDDHDQPLVGVNVRIGILKSDGGRDSLSQKTNSEGVAILPSLTVGDRQAYRAEITADGARFSSTPFRMPHRNGYQVLLRRLPTTHDSRDVVLYVGAVSVELKDERLKIAQQLRLVNIGGSVYVFPEGGMRIPLPKGFTAFETQENMTDQRVSSTDNELKIEGSIPPGQTSLLWGYDLPIEGTEMTVELDNPWTTFAYRVLADAAPGLTMRVDDMPAPEQHESEEGTYWVTETMRRPEQEAMRHIRIHLAGIPGPGPYRFIAAGLALLALGLGYAFSRRPVDPSGTARLLASRKQQLTAQLAALANEHRAGDIGPETFASEKARLTDALALLLWQQAQRKEAGDSTNRKATAGA